MGDFKIRTWEEIGRRIVEIRGNEWYNSEEEDGGVERINERNGKKGKQKGTVSGKTKAPCGGAGVGVAKCSKKIFIA